jgi:hypothetical protein
MIQEHFDMTLADKLSLIAQVLAKVAYNFWPAIVFAVIAGIIIHRQENAGKGINPRKRR